MISDNPLAIFQGGEVPKGEGCLGDAISECTFVDWWLCEEHGGHDLVDLLRSGHFRLIHSQDLICEPSPIEHLHRFDELAVQITKISSHHCHL